MKLKEKLYSPELLAELAAKGIKTHNSRGDLLEPEEIIRNYNLNYRYSADHTHLYEDFVKEFHDECLEIGKNLIKNNGKVSLQIALDGDAVLGLDVSSDMFLHAGCDPYLDFLDALFLNFKKYVQSRPYSPILKKEFYRDIENNENPLEDGYTAKFLHNFFTENKGSEQVEIEKEFIKKYDPTYYADLEHAGVFTPKEDEND